MVVILEEKMNILRLILKNFIVLLRSRVSSLIILFGPLLIVLLAGYAFDNNDSFELKVGVYINETTDLYDRFVESLQQEFTLIEYDNPKDCINDVTSLKTHSCLEFDGDFELEQGNTNHIEIHVDKSKVNIVDLIQNALNKVIFVESTEISSDLTDVLLTSLADTSIQLTAWNELITADILVAQNGLDTNLQRLQTNIEGIDLSYENPEDSVDTLLDEKNNLGNIINDYKDQFETILEQYDKTLNEIKALAIEGDPVDLKATSAKDLVDTYQTQVDAINLQSEGAYTDLNDAIETVTGSIEDLEETVADTAVLKNRFAKDLGTYRSNLQEITQTITLLGEEIESTNNAIKNIAITNTTNIVSPVTSSISSVVTSSSRLNYIFPSLIMLVIMFVGIMLGSTLVSIEKNSPARFRLFTTPASSLSFIMSTFITVVLLVFVQLLLVLIAGQHLFGIDVWQNVFATSVVLALSTIIFTLIGMVLGYLFANEQTTILAAISLGSAFILISDFILPLESIPLALREYISLTPFVLLSASLRRTMIFDSPLEAITTQLGYAAIYAVALFILIVVAQKLLKLFVVYSSTRKK